MKIDPSEEKQTEEQLDEYYNEEEFEPVRPRMLNKLGSPLVVGGGIGLLLLILVITFLTMGRSSREDFQYQMIEERFAGLENRFAAYEGTANRLDRIFEDLERLKGLPDRVDRIEADLLKEIEALKTELARVLKDNTKKAKTTASGGKSGTKAAKQATYHRVKKGETLYSISKRYQTSVEAIRKLNKMSPAAPIYPDQKLRVR